MVSKKENQEKGHTKPKKNKQRNGETNTKNVKLGHRRRRRDTRSRYLRC